MARRIRLWKAVLLAMVGGIVASVLGLLHSKPAQAQQGRAESVSKPRFFWDRHWLRLPVPGDSDQDLLLNREEESLGLDPYDPDQNGSRVIDGPEVAWMNDEVIDSLPLWNPGDPPPTEIVKTEFLMDGIETCDVCGAEVNMGFLRIYNPWKDLAIDIPFIGMHYLRCGSFSHDGSIHEGRVDVELLAAVLEDLHQLKVENDTDTDLLADAEELAIGTDPANPDENGDFVRDGLTLALRLLAGIDRLPYGPLPDEPYKVEHLAWGLENCEICGEAVNMGYLEVTDPVEGLTVEIPFVGLHFMAHGSFSFDGTVHDGRVIVDRLFAILRDR
ncbi:MAG: hypothetical protein AB1486_07370 [Planctomycetota bacterium]